MIVVVASVHHTGTHFVVDELFKGWRHYAMSYGNIKGPIGDGVTRIHIDKDQSIYLPRWMEHQPLVVPMRHPASVVESWLARDKPIEPLLPQWEMLKTMVDPARPIYLPLDVPDRDRWLGELNGKLGLKLQTDWPVIMSCGKSAVLSDVHRAAVVEVMADGFFDRFGYEV